MVCRREFLDLFSPSKRTWWSWDVVCGSFQEELQLWTRRMMGDIEISGICISYDNICLAI